MLVQQILNGFYANTDANRYYRQVEVLQNAINQFSLTLSKKLGGNLADYRLNAPVSAKYFDETSNLETQLAPFIQNYSAGFTGNIININPSGRTISKILGIRLNYGSGFGRPARDYPQNQFYEAVDSRVHPATEKQPYYMLNGKNSYEIAPAPVETANCSIDYLVYPLNCILVSTDQISPSGVPILDTTRSVDLEWDLGMADTFVNGIMGILGINMANGMVSQIGNAKQNQDL